MLLTTIVVRFAWVMTHNAIIRWRIRRAGFHPPRPMTPPTARGGLITAWCGMRGIVTLAAALALPTGAAGRAFPYRDLIVFTAFCVVLGTLVLQGLSLRPLLRALALRDDDPVGREVGRARERTLQAVRESLEGNESAEAEAVRRECTSLLGRAESLPAQGEAGIARENELRRRALAAPRRALSQMRADDEIGDPAFHRLEEELDWVEMSSILR